MSGKRTESSNGVLLVLAFALLATSSNAHERPYVHSHQEILEQENVRVEGVIVSGEEDAANIPDRYRGVVIPEGGWKVQLPEDDGPPIWETPAKMYVERCTPPNVPGNGQGVQNFCGPHKPHYQEKTILWDVEETPRAVTLTTSKIRFGPFNLERRGRGGMAEGTDDFRITIWGRSAANYGMDADEEPRFLGAYSNLLPLAEEVFTLEGSEKKVVFVTAELKSIVTAIKITLQVDDEKSEFPAACGHLPTWSNNPGPLDTRCLQAGINPLALITPKWTPIGIVYEPPGNCSWSRLTNLHTVGVTASFATENTTSTHFVSDSGFAWDSEHIESTRINTNARDSSISMKVASSISIGTVGNPDCGDEPGPESEQENSGPGYGEVFILLENAPAVYWDTGDVRGVTLSPLTNPTAPYRTRRFTANQIRTGEGLPPGVTFEEEEKNAILSLSPFVVGEDGEVTFKGDNARFIELGAPDGIGAGLKLEYLQSTDMVVGSGTTLTEVVKSGVNSSTESDPVVDYTMTALQAGMQKGMEKGVKSLSGVNPLLGTLATSIVKKIEVPVFYQDQSKTSIQTTMRSSNEISRRAEDSVIQQFHIEDSNRGMNLQLLYDRIFGSFVFVDLDEGAGFVNNPMLSLLPSIVVEADEDGTLVSEISIEGEAAEILAEAGAINLNPASNNSYLSYEGRVPVRMMADVPLSTDNGQGQIKDERGLFAENAQSLYIAEDENGNAVALVWVNSN